MLVAVLIVNCEVADDEEAGRDTGFDDAHDTSSKASAAAATVRIFLPTSQKVLCEGGPCGEIR